MKSCGPCTLCCTVLDIPELAKPAGRPCVHLGQGCGIYPDRPSPCRVFTCGWLATEALGELWRPDIAGFLIRDERDNGQLCIDVAPDRAGSWRREPYLRQLRAWSQMVWSKEGSVVVYEAERTVILFPEGDIEISPLKEGEALAVGYLRRAGAWWPMVEKRGGEGPSTRWLGTRSRP